MFSKLQICKIPPPKTLVKWGSSCVFPSSRLGIYHNDGLRAFGAQAVILQQPWYLPIICSSICCSNSSSNCSSYCFTLSHSHTFTLSPLTTPLSHSHQSPHWSKTDFHATFKVLFIYTLGGLLPWRWCCLAPPALLVVQVLFEQHFGLSNISTSLSH